MVLDDPTANVLAALFAFAGVVIVAWIGRSKRPEAQSIPLASSPSLERVVDRFSDVVAAVQLAIGQLQGQMRSIESTTDRLDDISQRVAVAEHAIDRLDLSMSIMDDVKQQVHTIKHTLSGLMERERAKDALRYPHPGYGAE